MRGSRNGVPADRGVSSVVDAMLILAILVIAGDVLFNGALTDGQRNKDINANRALLDDIHDLDKQTRLAVGTDRDRGASGDTLFCDQGSCNGDDFEQLTTNPDSPPSVSNHTSYFHLRDGSPLVGQEFTRGRLIIRLEVPK